MKIKLTYSDGSFKIKDFEDWDTAQWYIHNEGDNLIEYEIISPRRRDDDIRQRQSIQRKE